MIENAAYYWSPVAFIIGIIFLCLFMLYVPKILGGKAEGKAKHEPFESGVVSVGNSRIRLSAKFYLVAIFFVIFDLEALFLYAYAVSVRETSWLGFAGAAVFILILLVGLIYELSLGAMNWSPVDRGLSNRKMALPLFADRKNTAYSAQELADITSFNGVEELELDPRGNVPAQLSGQVNSHLDKKDKSS